MFQIIVWVIFKKMSEYIVCFGQISTFLTERSVYRLKAKPFVSS